MREEEAFYDHLIGVFEAAMEAPQGEDERNPCVEQALFEVYQAHNLSGYRLHRELLTTTMADQKMADLFAAIMSTEGIQDAEKAGLYLEAVREQVRMVIAQLPVNTVYVFEDGSAINMHTGKAMGFLKEHEEAAV